MVGCVIVRDGQVIGEGYHQQFGGPHAEPNALDDCRRRGRSPEGATAYVTLEPCCHTNKKTPPCAPRLVEAEVARVVIGCLDPNPAVNGNGVAMLRAAGIRVDGPVLEGEAKQLIEPFMAGTSGPYVTLKWAESADGKVAGPGGRRTQISGSEASRVVHQLRARCDGVVVGIGTVLNDDPLLTPRDVPIRHKPVRIVLDRKLRLPLTSQLVRTAREWPTVVIFNYFDAGHGRAAGRLQAAGVALHGHDVSGTDDDEDLDIAVEGVMRDKLHLREVLVEAGPTLAARFFSYRGCYSVLEPGKAPVTFPARSVDRVWVIRSPVVIGDPTAPDAPRVPDWLVPTGTIRLGADTLTEYRSPMYTTDDGDDVFPVVPSADFVLAAEAAPT
jgi:diaminohydroxyphosphoribosylaminopyrimidine deaminase/5-amino-6-(5-phosphoribosylamino)uracil reductase